MGGTFAEISAKKGRDFLINPTMLVVSRLVRNATKKWLVWIWVNSQICPLERGSRLSQPPRQLPIRGIDAFCSETKCIVSSKVEPCVDKDEPCLDRRSIVTRMRRKKIITTKGKKAARERPAAALPKDTYLWLSNVGSEGRIIFSSKEDFDRFEAYLYLLNSIDSPRVANLFAGGREREIFTTARGEKLVAIGAFCFTPKEFHILVTPLVDGGVAKFMQKLQTAYTMFFNHKYQRSGRLFHSAYRSHAARSHEELQYFFVNVHLNAMKLFNERWHELAREELVSLAASAMKYRYSSIGEHRENTPLITSPENFPKYLKTHRSANGHVRAWLRGIDRLNH